MTNKTKVLHVTSVHIHTDTRILLKECKSLSKIYDVHLINPFYEGKIDNINLHKVIFFRNRLLRVLTSWLLVLPKSCFINYKVIHFHDPELLFAVPIWKIFGKKIIYDVHENYSKQVYTKEYIPLVMRKLLQQVIKFIEYIYAYFVDIIIVVHQDLNFILNKFKKHITISNAPILDYKFVPKTRKKQFCYIGVISEERGILKMAKIFNELKVDFVLAGNFSSKKLKKKIISLKNIKYLGIINREEVIKVISESTCGVCTYLPLPNHMISNPNKLFEYLNYGTPVICSNFESYKDIIDEKYSFVHYVDVNNKSEIVKNIKNILSMNDNELNNSGEEANKFIEKNYNWDIEANKLIESYKKILSK
ncbi:MAG: glycosyltransferase [Flavobacterium sp.]|nr:glycosyltransferase [Flavobacterium sp.]